MSIQDSLSMATSLGKAGEGITSEFLSSLNSYRHGYLLYNNLFIRNKSGVLYQVDHLLLSRFGIAVIETKHYSGTVFCSEQDKYWPVYSEKGKRYELYNPLYQSYGHKVAVRQFVSSVVPPSKLMRSVTDFICFTGVARLKGIEMLEKVTTPETLLTRVLHIDQEILSNKVIKTLDTLFTNIESNRGELEVEHSLSLNDKLNEDLSL